MDETLSNYCGRRTVEQIGEFTFKTYCGVSRERHDDRHPFVEQPASAIELRIRAEKASE